MQWSQHPKPLGRLGKQQAFHLNAGFNCISKCHMCDAVDWHRVDSGAAWRSTVGQNRSTSPFWNVEIPLLSIPGMVSTTILPDSCHCFHLGWGVDMAASGVVLMAKRGVLAGRTLESRLSDAYARFVAWCAQNHKTTAIDIWTTKKMDMGTNLGHMFGNASHMLLRNNDFPESLGTSKAFDTSLVLAWIETELDALDAWCQEKVEPEPLEPRTAPMTTTFRP